MVLLGTGWLFFPETMLGWWSVETDATGVYVARRYGGLLLQGDSCTTSWLSECRRRLRRAPESAAPPAERPVSAACDGQDGGLTWGQAIQRGRVSVRFRTGVR